MRLIDHITQVLSSRSGEKSPVRPRSGYVVFSGPYLSNSAGVNCLHRLCDELNRAGYPSFTTGGDIAAPHLNAPIIDEELAASLCAGGFIAIYPETVSGNPLNAHEVVRWVLNRPGLLGGEELYDESELVFSYSDVFTPYIKNRIAGKLHMPTIDETLFYCDDADLSKRNLQCYYVGKSQWKDGFVDPAQAFEINRTTPNKTELGKLFRSAKVLYCFDNSTVLIYEALLCGCPVVVIPDGTHQREDFAALELGSEGISWGTGEYTGAEVNVSNLRARHDAVRREFSRQFDRMVAVSQAQVREAVDWDTVALKRRNWWRQPGVAVAKTGREALRRGRKAERVIRRWRKRRQESLRNWRGERNLPRLDASAFYCDDWSLANRRLECYLSNSQCFQLPEFDTSKVFEITPTTSASQMSKLFRASRRFYSFEPDNPLVKYALACGCPVSVIGNSEFVQTVLEPIADASGAAGQQLTSINSSCIAAT